MLGETGQEQKELEQILITNEGYFVTISLTDWCSLKRFQRSQNNNN